MININIEFIKQLSRPTPSKIVLLVIDGLGGLPDTQSGKTELETANTPNLDALASKSICGLSETISPGITPGSAPGHLVLFGYDPVTFRIGRGALEAMGIDYPLQPGDIAARGNFCTVDNNEIITDRRAGRISIEQSGKLCRLLDNLTIDGVRVFSLPVKDHRMALVLHGEGLSPDISDSDPQQTEMVPLKVKANSKTAERTADIVNKFLIRAKDILAEYYPANMLLLRGFDEKPHFPSMSEVYKLKPAAIASYPMYRGLARAVGMDILNTGSSIEDEIETLKHNYNNYDYFFIHIKETDAMGEDGDFEAKVKAIEHVDKIIPDITALKPNVIVVTGDHSTPALIKGHSWHPVPLLLYSEWCRPDKVKQFSESACISGGLGRMPAIDIMPLAMANALKLNKYGA
ncbi:MAG: 2,3-bisphosphoglycerate-independent phosphoglycerate mutase [Dehalococcoidales bacterium]|nr:2,3-bisphosphoglycerate-independent phosphoglycerate mutase [Dehalococcoidales bacterium]